MDMKLFQKDGKTYTRIKILIRSLWRWKIISNQNLELTLVIRQKIADIFTMKLNAI